MKYIYIYIFLFILLLITIPLNAQIKGLSIGLGGSVNYFQSAASATSLKNFKQFLLHFHLKFETMETMKLKGQIQANFYNKQIRFGQQYVFASGGKMTEGFHHDYISSDVVLSAAFNHQIKREMKVQPRLGFFVSFNQYVGTTEYTALSGWRGLSSTSNSQSMYSYAIKTDESPFFIYPGIFTGFSILKNNKKGRAFSIFTDFYLAPRNIFSNPFQYLLNGDSMELQGKYHYLNIGFRGDLFYKK